MLRSPSPSRNRDQVERAHVRPSATGHASAHYNLTLNGFRGLCALTVFAHHVLNARLLTEPQDPIGASIWYAVESLRYGVELFFMVSGYVIIASLRRHASTRDFLRDRLLRIFPTWIPILAALFLFGALEGWGPFATGRGGSMFGLFLANLLLLPPLLPLPAVHPASWSLSYEWIFYLMSAVLRDLAQQARGHRRFALIAWCALCLSLIAALPRGLFFVPGALAALYADRLRPHKHLFRFTGWGLLAFLLCWRGTDAALAEFGYPLLPWFADSRILWCVAAFASSLYLVVGLTQEVGTLSRWLRAPTVQFFGTISYSFYLWQAPVFHVVKGITRRQVVPSYGVLGGVVFFALVSLAIAIPVSWLSWRFTEQELAKWLKRRWMQRAREAHARPAAGSTPRTQP